MTTQQKYSCIILIISLLSALVVLATTDRVVVYTDRGYPIIMEDGHEYHPEDMR